MAFFMQPKSLVPLVSLWFVLQVAEVLAQPARTASKIKQVETGLRLSQAEKDNLPMLLEERMRFYQVPGVCIAVINNFQIEWVKAYGIKDARTGQPLTSKTLFQVASMSKPVTAVATMKLVEQGKLSLDGDISLYLRSWQLPHNTYTAVKKVTIRQLLSHTAGITGGGFDGYPRSATIPSLSAILAGRSPATNTSFQVDTLPGSRWNYSGPGYVILQQVLVDVTAKPFHDLVRQLVLAPLKMRRSRFTPDGESLRNYAAGHTAGQVLDQGGQFRIMPESAAAGLWSTAPEMARFGVEMQRSLRNRSHKVLSQTSAQTMVTPVQGEYGLGFTLYQKDQNYFGHRGQNPGYMSRMILHKQQGYGIVVLTNDENDALIKEIIRSVAAAYQWKNFSF